MVVKNQNTKEFMQYDSIYINYKIGGRIKGRTEEGKEEAWWKGGALYKQGRTEGWA